MPDEPRKCFYIPADAFVPGKGWIPSLVTENEPGHAPLAGDGSYFAEPWYWGMTFQEARTIAAAENAKLGLTEQDVNDIIISSMRASNA
jgi:hypothetical protein